MEEKIPRTGKFIYVKEEDKTVEKWIPDWLEEGCYSPKYENNCYEGYNFKDRYNMRLTQEEIDRIASINMEDVMKYIMKMEIEDPFPYFKSDYQKITHESTIEEGVNKKLNLKNN